MLSRDVFEKKIKLYVTLHGNDLQGLLEDFNHEKHCKECRRSHGNICQLPYNTYTFVQKARTKEILFWDKNKRLVRELLDLWFEEKYPHADVPRLLLVSQKLLGLGAELKTICFGFLNKGDNNE